MICTSCYNQVPDKLRFCTHCGQLISYPLMDVTVSWTSIYNQGCRHYNSGNITLARQHFEAVVQHNPAHHLSWYNLGTIYLKDGLLDKAAVCLLAAKQLNPYHIPSRLNLAACLARQKKLDAAVKELRDLLQLDPGNTQAQTALTKLHSLRSRKMEK
ncbi:MAG: tetratricopeptide repeat protein [Thermoanaerobacteraceae bacterium]|nr:tetratricopeptide repeat protein [Thermoanaerobacteraceae bacterium]